MNDKKTPTKAEAREALIAALDAFRKGHATHADVVKARDAYNKASQHDPDTFDAQLKAAREMVK